MSTVVVGRGPRAAGPELPEGEVELQEPPALPDLERPDMSSTLAYLPMGLGSGAMILVFAGPSAGALMYIVSGLMSVSSVFMVVAQFIRPLSERKQKLKGERRDYLRYLIQVRRQARRAMTQQRAALEWDQPAPSRLWAVATSTRLWERRATHPDFAEVRIGLGRQRSALRLVPPQTKPVEDLEPLCSSALRRFITVHSAIDDVPIGIRLGAFPVIAVRGPGADTRGFIRALLARLVTFHSPENLRIAIIAGREHAEHWDWTKWLPHVAHPTRTDAAGPVRMHVTHPHDLFELLGPAFTERPAFDPTALPTADEPLLVIVSDNADVPADSRLLLGGLCNIVLIDLAEAEPVDPAARPAAGTAARPAAAPAGDRVAAHAVTLVVDGDRLESRVDGTTTDLGRPDSLSLVRATALARILSPLRTAGMGDVAEPMATDFDVTRLLGVRNPRTYDVHALWRSRDRRSALRVPIGLGPDGQIVELDLKESAQGGMGPHGVIIGATGSGKSELLRTLVITLAVTHSSEQLNFVLVDFKGGATFLGLDVLPHTSAMITNLADELPLVDRMQDSLHGELIRRQELLRRTGYTSRRDHEQARAGGAALDALPSLLVVVDEFSELLATKPEFIDLFVMIGRLGRSLGVHLLLASQRLDEGRIHQLETHLSYRIALRTFSAMESRTIIGVPDAYELPSVPGHGYLKTDTTTLIRFKAGYVSAPCEAPAPAADRAPDLTHEDVIPFGTALLQPRPGRQVASNAPAEADAAGVSGADSLLSVLTGRLADQGPMAREVWLPPLAESPSLDSLLPGIAVQPGRGATAGAWPGCGRLLAPVGLVDRPFEQRRDLLVADLSGAAGNVGIVGGPQTGKSTLLRTLLLSFASTHTPSEAQFYCLDFGGGTLSTIAGLPHVGSVSGRMDRDRVRRTVAEMSALVEQRERIFAERGVESIQAYRALRAAGGVDDPFGDVFLVVDGWFTVRQDFEDLESRISALATVGLGYGVHVVITASRWSEIRPSLRDLLGTRLELKLGDALESEIGSRAAGGVPAVPGRGLTSDAKHFLGALPRLDQRHTTEGLGDAVRDAVGLLVESWPGTPAPPVRLLPARLPVEQLTAPTGNMRVSVGWNEERLAEVVHDFEQVPHLMCFGDAETGKTNLLRLVLRAIRTRYQPSKAGIVLGDFGRALGSEAPEAYRLGYAVTGEALTELCRKAAVSLRRRLPGPDVTAEQLRRRDWWTGKRLFVVVDDYDLATSGMTSPLEPLAELLAHGAEVGLHVVVTRSSSGAIRAMMDPVLRRLWELGAPGVLLSYPKEEGKFLGEAPPRMLPPGRAQWVTRRGVTLIQTGFVEPAPTPITP